MLGFAFSPKLPQQQVSGPQPYPVLNVRANPVHPL
jgi:hypothetical protein